MQPAPAKTPSIKHKGAVLSCAIMPRHAMLCCATVPLFRGDMRTKTSCVAGLSLSATEPYSSTRRSDASRSRTADSFRRAHAPRTRPTSGLDMMGLRRASITSSHSMRVDTNAVLRYAVAMPLLCHCCAITSSRSTSSSRVAIGSAHTGHSPK